jgi:hypothetical protein
MITGMLNNSGWHVNHKGSNSGSGGAESPAKNNPRRSTLAEPLSGQVVMQCPAGQWMGRASAAAERPNHVWSMTFRIGRTTGGSSAHQHHRRVRKNSRDRVNRKAILSTGRRSDVPSVHCSNVTRSVHPARPPEYIRSDNGAGLSKKVRAWIRHQWVPKQHSSHRDHLGENGCCEASAHGSGPSRQCFLASAG